VIAVAVVTAIVADRQQLESFFINLF